jgi:hypothetical protein
MPCVDDWGRMIFHSESQRYGEETEEKERTLLNQECKRMRHDLPQRGTHLHFLRDFRVSLRLRVKSDSIWTSLL